MKKLNDLWNNGIYFLKSNFYYFYKKNLKNKLKITKTKFQRKKNLKKRILNTNKTNTNKKRTKNMY